jgi:peptide/nickel transport system ATP-binding protein
MASTTLIEVANLRIEATIEERRRLLVSGVDLSVSSGEVLAIVGESGSGKSLTARALVGLLPRGVTASGSARFEGVELIGAREAELQRVRGNGIALVLQDPFTTLNPLMKCYTQLRPTRGPRRSRREQREDAVRRLAEVGIDDPNVADQYPWQLSGGMRQRVALASALANDPKLLIADEFSTALDVTTQKEIWLLLRGVQKARGMGLLIITHDLRMAFSMCDKVHVMYSGSLMETGSATSLSEHPMHPYTLGLLLAEPDIAHASNPELLMRGSVPSADEVIGKCAFSARCPWATPACDLASPPLRSLEGGDRATACARIDEISQEMAELHQRQAEESPDLVVASARAGKGEPVLVVNELQKTFRGDDDARSVVALAGVSLKVERGESVALVGGSGSGKTTLARCLVGLETPNAGTIEIGGLDASVPNRLTRRQQTQLRDQIQYVFQDPYSSLNPTKTVGATLAEAVTLRLGKDKSSVAPRVRELLRTVGLSTTYEDRKPAALSGGERQRVAIARALALEPRIVVCDEPVSALDVSVQAQVLDLLNEIRVQTGVSYLFITHDLAVVRQVADRVYVLRKGEIVEHGPMAELLENPVAQYTRELLAAVPGQWDRDSGAAVDRASSPSATGHT